MMLKTFVFLIFTLYPLRVESLAVAPVGNAFVNYAISNVAPRINGKVYEMIRGKKGQEQAVNMEGSNVPNKKSSSSGFLFKFVLFLGACALIVYAFSKSKLSKKRRKIKVLPKKFVTAKKIEKHKKQLLKTWAKWNKTFGLQGDAADILKEQANKKFLDWKESKIKEAINMIDNTKYDPELSDEQVLAIKAKKKKLLEEKVIPLLEMTSDTTLKEAIDSLKEVAVTIQDDFDTDLDSVLEVVGKLDGTKVVTTQPQSHISSLKSILQSLTSHELLEKAKAFIFGYDSFARYVIELNNMIALHKDDLACEWNKLQSPNGESLE